MPELYPNNETAGWKFSSNDTRFVSSISISATAITDNGDEVIAL